MPLQETSGTASYDAFGGGAAAVPVYIEDVFSTWLYTGNGSTQTITNGIDLSGQGGMVWLKARSSTSYNVITDTVRGAGQMLRSESTAANESIAGRSFYSTGFDVNGSSNNYGNGTNTTYASWTFRKQPKFFDVVTWTGNAATPRTITHSLGSVPGCIIVKKYSGTAEDWFVFHRSLGNTSTFAYFLNLNNTNAQDTGGYGMEKSTSWTSTTFSLVSGGGSSLNENGANYVAYLFAHNAGGFGLTGTDNVISCGSFTTNASGGVAAQNLGYEPQFIIYKRTNGAEDWRMLDNMRGMWVGTPYNASPTLYPNLSNAEANNEYFTVSATGFSMPDGALGSSATYIYIAIRRGPMKTPTSGTSVFNTVFRNASAGLPQWNSGFVTDFSIVMDRDGSGNIDTVDRLRGTKRLLTYSTAAESNGSPNTLWDYMNGFGATSGSLYDRQLAYMYRRAPGFFDVVCYTSAGASNTTFNHNLGVTPELILLKTRSNANDWYVYSKSLTNPSNYYLVLNSTAAQADIGATQWTVSSTQVTVAPFITSNGWTNVAYLFATVAGVSKVGSYTGTGALQTVNCGFTSGARFVLVKRTDASGDWYVYDSARGITSGNDPYLLLNSTAAEVTSTNYVDTDTTGFKVTAAAPAGLNANGGTYIFLAIA